MEESLVKVIVWPAVVLIVAIIAIFVFRSQVAALISRTKRVGKGGLETYETQPTPPTEEKKGLEEFLQTFDSPLLLRQERLILENLRVRKLEVPQDREKALVRSLASTGLVLHFEQVYGVIWASQVATLYHLNPRAGGADISELIPAYEAAKANYPSMYEKYPFDQWLGFLKAMNLVVEQNSRLFITEDGREFLKYLIATAKTGPFQG